MTTNTTQQTEATIVRHRQAIRTGVDAILSNYTDDSIFFTQNGPVRGLAELRAVFEDILQTAPPGLLDAMEIVQLDVDGEVGYMVSKAKDFFFMTTDTFVVRDGKIMIHTTFIPEAIDAR